MLAIESAGDRLAYGATTQILRQHRRPGDRLQHRPMRARRRHKRGNDQDFCKTREHDFGIMGLSG